jgi:Protein of unknown function (DUF2971)
MANGLGDTNNAEMERAIQDGVIPPGPLWKYFSLSQNQNPSWKVKLHQICIEGKLYCSTPRDFNDPFDCLPSVASPQTLDKIASGADLLIAKFAESLPEHHPTEIADLANERLLSLSPEDLMEWSKLSCETTARQMGVFCLSERVDSVLMWSHYANNHTGIAIMFDPLINLKGGLMSLLKVRYQAARPKISYFDSEDVMGFADALSTKASFWDYEMEWRKIVPNGAGTLAQFDSKIVTGLAFGANCTADARRVVKDVLGDREMNFWEMVPSADNFELHLSKEQP